MRAFPHALLAALPVALAIPAQAQSPPDEQIPYQGRLTDASGQPLASQTELVTSTLLVNSAFTQPATVTLERPTLGTTSGAVYASPEAAGLASPFAVAGQGTPEAWRRASTSSA